MINIARLIDHTLLKPDATADQVRKLCTEAREYDFAAVCLNPTHVKLAAQLLAGSQIAVCTVVGFPLGANLTVTKAIETEQVISEGATEVDMVINLGALKVGNLELVETDIAAVVAVAHAHKAICKVIIETGLLTEAEKVTACQLVKQAGADFVKTATGFNSGGATVADVTLMRQTVGPEMGVKAAGGVRSLADARSMVEAGATRIGTSSGVKIMEEALT
ncbi:MAG TPA: deoxyribose-phosphate aldolase [Anaerolineae bacterium]|nr:deoxyribose-phosphate aldolase [Anaerolineae bacterium]HMR67863.1 deoxyribose-phosphate aldolase [Anaerolineae bacterium]